jgi:hypothetical protein
MDEEDMIRSGQVSRPRSLLVCMPLGPVIQMVYGVYDLLNRSRRLWLVVFLSPHRSH